VVKKRVSGECTERSPGPVGDAAAARGLSVRVFLYNAKADKKTELWTVSRSGREIASWVDRTGSLRHRETLYKVKTAAEMIDKVAELEGLI
jgi:hypothetical protein